MEIDRYFEQIVDPTIADFEANPTSVRYSNSTKRASLRPLTFFRSLKP
jgi:hypothetical protein